ncbi:MAG: DUF3108 domain-containing protein [Pseudomonadota bacterium]
MGRRHALAWALLLSGLIHLAGLVGPLRLDLKPLPAIDVPIEASLEPARVLAAARPKRQPRIERGVPRPVEAPEPQPMDSLVVPAPEVPEPPPVPSESPLAAPAQVPEDVQPTPVAEAVPPAVVQAEAGLRVLPERLTLHYTAQLGDGDAGFVAGEALYIWQASAGRYALTSRLQATGLAALFMRGAIEQTSEGELTSTGLRPLRYVLERKSGRRDTAQFDWAAGQLQFGNGKQAMLTGQAQDLLSFPFHLALVADERKPGLALSVTNGRRLRQYVFQTVGSSRLVMHGQSMEALHLRGMRPGEGQLDVWLDLGRHGIPVRIRTEDTQAKVIELRLKRVGELNEPSGGEPETRVEPIGGFLGFDQG